MLNYYKSLSPFKRRYIPIIASISAVFFISIILIFSLPAISRDILTNKNNKSKSGWPIRLSAPYIDMSSWVDTANAYSINGAPNLAKLYEDSGFAYFNLGFIQPDTTSPLNSDGSIRWGWGGYASLGNNGTSSSQYDGINTSLKSLRDKGGDYAISIGGQLGDAPWVVTQNQDMLEKFYNEVIENYSLKRMDLDIEESNQDHAQNIVNARAIKNIQDKTNIEITLTIPIMPSGWEQKQINIITAYLDAGIDIKLINSMTMCYGTGVNSDEDYGSASVRAITNSVKQLKDIYSNYGILLSTDQAYLKTGATFSIGYESNLYPVFTTSMASTIVEDAKKHRYGLVSMWSMGRDAMLTSNQAISEPFTFTKELKKYENIYD